MDTKDLCEHTRIRLIAAAVGHQQCTKTESNIIPLPGTDRVIAIGTRAQVRGLLAADITAPAGIDLDKPLTGEDLMRVVFQRPDLSQAGREAEISYVMRGPGEIIMCGADFDAIAEHVNALARKAAPAAGDLGKHYSVLSELFDVATKYKAAVESDTLGEQNEEDLTEALKDAEHWLLSNASALAAQQHRESATDRAINRACGELPLGYDVLIELENGAGCVVWYDADGERHVVDGEGYISQDIGEAVDRAIEHAAEHAPAASQVDSEGGHHD